MQAPLDEVEIQSLLRELDSGDPAVRRKAAEATLAHEELDARIVEKLKGLAANDPDPGVRWAAALALLHTGVELPEETWQKAQPPAPPAVPIPRVIKWRDFLIGFVGWFLINGLLWLEAPNMEVGCITFPANLGLLITLAVIRRTRWVALGILSALALNFVIALIRGMAFNGICFVPFFVNSGSF